VKTQALILRRTYVLYIYFSRIAINDDQVDFFYYYYMVNVHGHYFRMVMVFKLFIV
jgi:hypothetical protein